MKALHKEVSQKNISKIRIEFWRKEGKIRERHSETRQVLANWIRRERDTLHYFAERVEK